MSVCLSVGKVVFADVMSAALAFSGSSYYDNSWRHAAAMVTSPPLRPAADTADSLISRLAKYVIRIAEYVCRLFTHAGVCVCVCVSRVISGSVRVCVSVCLCVCV